MSKPPAWSMSVGPSHLLMEPGHTAHLAVTDTGSRPLTVTSSVVRVGEAGARCVPAPGTVTGISISPDHLSLKAGQTGYATVHVAPGAPDADAAALFTASAGEGTGTARVSGAVGSQVVVGHVPGCHIPAAAGPAQPGIGGMVMVAVLLALALTALVATGHWARKHLRWQ